MKFSSADRNQLKDGCLSCLMSEPDRTVRTAVAQLVATLARHELGGKKDGGWPELFTFILARLDSQNSQERVMGIMMLRLVCHYQMFLVLNLPSASSLTPPEKGWPTD